MSHVKKYGPRRNYEVTSERSGGRVQEEIHLEVHFQSVLGFGDTSL